jgi:hypothetical protein
MRSRTLLAVVLMAMGLGAFGALSVDCNSNELVPTDSGAEATPEDSEVCPTNVEKQNGTACEAPDGYLCPTSFPCADPPIPQQANCVCSGGKWRCSYASGEGGAIAPGSAPVCLEGESDADNSCPLNEAPGVPCTVAGLLCYYPGEQCKGATFPDTDAGLPSTDTCQCVGGSDAGSEPGDTVDLVFSCLRAVCNPSRDAASLPDGSEAGSNEGGGAREGGPTDGATRDTGGLPEGETSDGPVDGSARG